MTETDKLIRSLERLRSRQFDDNYVEACDAGIAALRALEKIRALVEGRESELAEDIKELLP